MNTLNSKENKITDFIVKVQHKAIICLKVLVQLFITAISVYVLVILTVSIKENPKSFLLVLDRYLSLILNSWPTAVMVIGLTLLITQHNSIDEFIRKRMTKAGPGGVEGGILNPQESLADLNAASSSERPVTIVNPTIRNSEEIKSATATTESIPPEQSLTVPELTSQIKELSKELSFERIYNTIFGTQISVLIWLRNNIAGLWYGALANVYEQWRTNDEVLKNYPLDNYIEYLITNGLVISIEETGWRKFQITDHGLDFLSFIERRGYNQYKPH